MENELVSPGTLGNVLAPRWNAWPEAESEALKPNTLYFKKEPWEIVTPAFNVFIAAQTSCQ